MDRTLSAATTPGQSGPGSNGNEGVLRILQSYSIIEASFSDCLMSYSRHSLVGVLPLCRDAVSVFYITSKLGHRTLVQGVLPLCRDAVSVFYSSSWLGHRTLVQGVLPLCRDAVSVFYSSSWLGHRTLVQGVLPRCRDAVNVFYSSSRLGYSYFGNLIVW